MEKRLIVDYLKENIKAQELLLKKATSIRKAAQLMIVAVARGQKIFWFGNGGSAADAQHLAAELVGRFELERKPLASVALSTDTSILTAIGNDYGFDKVFERQVAALVKNGDIVVGITTSGNSVNVINGLKKAKLLGAKTIALTGKTGGKLKGQVDCLIAVPSKRTSHIQELHIVVGHIICFLVEKSLKT